MNPTHKRSQAERHAGTETRPSRLKRMVHADLDAAPPAAGEVYAGERRIAQVYKPLTQRYAYFRQETTAALVIAVLAMLLAMAGPLLFGWGMLGVAIAVISGVIAVICVHRWYFHRFGPEHIQVERWQAAHRELQDAGDASLRPAGLLPTLTLVAIAGVDGFLSGSALASSVFANVFTPAMATLAATAWGVGVTYLLYKLVHAAALEANINERRHLVRNLSTSAEADDRERARRMKAAVGDVLGQSYDLRADRKSARWVLVGATVVLALSLFALRVGAGDPPAGGALAPARMIRT